MGASAYRVETLAGFKEAWTQSQQQTGVKVIVANTSKTDTYRDVMSSLNHSDVYAVPQGEGEQP